MLLPITGILPPLLEYIMLKDIDKAKSDLNKVLELEPTHSHAHSLFSLLQGIIYQPFHPLKKQVKPIYTKPSKQTTVNENMIDGWDSESFKSLKIASIPRSILPHSSTEKKEIQLKREYRISSAKTYPS